MDEIFGLPLHPLVVHAPVVLIPLAALGAIVVSISATWRDRLGWVVVGLVAAATVSAFVAVRSGQALKAALGETPAIERHEDAGTLVRLEVVAFLVVVAALLAVHTWGGHWFGGRGAYVLRAASVATILAAVLATFGVIRAGDTGAHAAWDGRVPGIGDTPVAPAAAGTGAVGITGFAFDPASVTVPAGTEVVWTNADPEVHTVTAEDGTFDSGSLDTGASFTLLFDTPGAYSYVCAIHPSMRGELIVEA